MKRSFYTSVLLFAGQLTLVLAPGACAEKAEDTVAQVQADTSVTAARPTPTVEKGMYFGPDLDGFALHNEYDDDGDGDGVNETHVRRYIDSKGDTAFSMTTNGQLWAWSLDTTGDDDSDVHKNYVIRDGNCDKVFDERYNLDAEFHVPACLAEGGAAEQPGTIRAPGSR